MYVFTHWLNTNSSPQIIAQMIPREWAIQNHESVDWTVNVHVNGDRSWVVNAGWSTKYYFFSGPGWVKLKAHYKLRQGDRIDMIFIPRTHFFFQLYNRDGDRKSVV